MDVKLSSKFILPKELKKGDIYSGNEQLQFQERHPIYKTLMKLEFEEALRNYRKVKHQK